MFAPSVSVSHVGLTGRDLLQRSIVDADAPAAVLCEPAPRAIVFIDTHAPDTVLLTAGVAPGVRAVLLDPRQDALALIAATLARSGPVDTVHIVAHGAPGELHFAAGAVSAESLASAAAALAAIGKHLGPEGRLVLWGCEVAEGQCGARFVEALRAATGVGIEASTHKVGSADHGGNWTLDASPAHTAAQAPFTRAALDRFSGVLVTPAIDLDPVAAGTGTTVTYTEQLGGGITIAPALTITDSDSPNLASATVRISRGFQSGDALLFANQFGITGSYSSASGLLTLTGTDTLAHYQTAMQSIRFERPGDNPTGIGVASRELEWTITDSDSTTSTPALARVNIAAVNDQIVNTVPGGTLNVSEDTRTAITGLSVADVDAGSQNVSVTLSVLHGVLDIATTGISSGLIATQVSGDTTGTIVLTGTLAQINATLANANGVTYQPFINYTGADTLTMSSNDRGNSGAASTADSDFRTLNVQPLAPASTLTVLQTVTLANDIDLDGRIDFGEIVRVDVQITNNSNVTSATGVSVAETFSGMADGTFNISPLAFDDSFTAVGNTLLEVGNATAQTGPQKSVAGSVTANDVQFDGTFTISSPADVTTINGGTVHMITSGPDMGSFTYISAANFTGPDTFTYSITDAGLDGNAGTTADNLTTTATVTITVAGQVWYVDAGAGPGGTGTSLNPFDQLADVSGATGPDTSGDTIYVKEATGDYDGNMTLLAGQQLIGSGAALIIGSDTLMAAGSATTIVNSTGDAITLSSGNTVSGFAIGNTSGAGVIGANVGALTISNMSDTGTGKIIDVTGLAGNSASISYGTATTTGSASEAIKLTGINGSFTATSGAISGVTGTDVLVSGGTATVNIGSSIAGSSNGSVEVTGRGAASGAVTFSGALNITGGTGISVHDNTAGSTTFSNASKVINTAGGAAVALTNNNGATVNFTGGGLDIDTTSATGFSATGGGTVNISGGSNTINSTAGQALNLNGVATTGITFSTMSSANSTSTGVQLTSVTGAGTVNLGGGAISGADTAGFQVGNGVAGSGGTAAINYSGSITSNDGRAVSIEDRAAGAGDINLSGTISHTSGADTGIFADDNLAGTITFTGATTINTSSGTARGVDLTDNNGATITFNAAGGGLDITTASGIGFNATGPGAAATSGGTVTVQGASNTINASTGTALNVAHTTIGANDLTFELISSGGAANVGVALDNTGTSGGLHVTGNGGAGSGGTIQHKTGADNSTTSGIGIYLNNTFDVQLDRMMLHDFDNYAIRGLGVQNFTLANSVVNGVNGNNTGPDEGAVIFGVRAGTSGLSGTASITATTISGSVEDNLGVYNASGTLNLTVTNTTITGAGNDGIGVELHTAGTTTVSVQNTVLTDNIGDHFNAVASNAANLNVQFGNSSGNVLSTSASAFASVLGGSIAVQTGGQWSGSGSANISNNTITFAKDTPINVNVGGSGTFGATISNNTIGATGVANSGTSGNKDAIRLVANGDKGALGAGANGGTLNALVTNNTIQQVDGRGLFVIGRDGGSAADPIQMNVTVQGNLFRQSASSNGQGIRFESGASSTPTPDHVTILANIGGAGALANNFSDDWGTNVGDPSPINFSEIRILNEIPGGNRFLLTGYGGAGTDDVAADTYLTGRNIFGVPSAANVTVSRTGANTWEPGGAPPLPLLAAQGGVEAAPAAPSPTAQTPGEPVPSGDTAAPVQSEPLPRPAPHEEPPVAAGPVSPTSPIVDDGVLSQAELDFTVAAAKARWIATGLTDSQVAALNTVTFSVENMQGLYLGSATPTAIKLDSDGAGYGWFLDATPAEDSEFANAAGTTRKLAAATAAPAGHIDLVTTVMHELGHVLGVQDTYDVASRDSLMYGYLYTGERRLPTGDTAQGAVAGSIEHEEFSLAPISLGTLPAGKTVTVQFSSQVSPSQSNQVVVNPTASAAVTSSFATANSVSVVTVDTLTLGNLVFEDVNQNGTFESGEGVGGVTLSLYADANDNDVPDAAAIATTTTAAGGAYAFEGLAPGNYIVGVDAGNFGAAGVLNGRVPIPGDIDPDNNIDTDSNARTIGGSGSLSRAITLDYGSEVSTDTSPMLDVNNTLDFGFTTNVPPVIANLNGNTVTFTEDGPAVLLDTGADALVTDADNLNFAGGTLTVSITAGKVNAEDVLGISQAASIVLSGTTPGSTVTVGATVVGTIAASGTGANGDNLIVSLNSNATPANISTLVQALTYSDSNTGNPSTSTRTVQVSLNDGLGGVATASTTVSFTAVNDAPVLDAGKTPALSATGEDAGAPVNGQAVGTLVSVLVDRLGSGTGLDNVNDPDGTGVAAGLALIGTDTSHGSWFYSLNGGTSWNAVGSVGANSALLLAADADNRLYFNPTPDFNGPVTSAITFRAWDTTSGTDGASGVDTVPNGGTTAFSVATDTANITVNAVADTPSISNATTPEDVQSTTGLVIARNAADDVDVTHFKITGITNGTLFQNDTITPINNGDFITFAQGAAGLKFSPTGDFSGTGNVTVQASTSNADAGLGGSQQSAAVTITEVNDPPTANADTVADIDEDSGTYSIAIAGLIANDDKGPANESTQILSPFSVGNAIGGTVAINGGNIDFTPTLDFDGPASFDFTIQDDGTTSGGPDPKTSTASVSFNVNSVNDAPVNVVPGGITVNEDTNFSITGLSFSDVEADAVPVTTLTLSVLHGTLTVLTTVAGGLDASEVLGNGTSTVTLSCSPITINTTLAALDGLVYRAQPDYNGADTLTVNSNDGGYQGADPGGPGADPNSEQDIDTVAITGNAVNDAPTFSVAPVPVTTQVGTADSKGYALVLQADGKIVLAGDASNGANRDFALVRYNADGSLDTSFSGDGKVVVPLAGDNVARAVALDVNGIVTTILAAGTSAADFAVTRFNSDGTLDGSFGTAGIATTNISGSDTGLATAVQTDHRILVAGQGGADFAVARYLPTGGLDTSFDGDGIVTTSFGGTAMARAMALQAGGETVVVGNANNDFALARYNADGSLDTSFDGAGGAGNGRFTTNIGGTDLARSVIVQADGKIVAVGESTVAGVTDAVLVRYNALDGTIDTGFGTAGVAKTRFGAASGGAFSVAQQADGKLVIAGYANGDFAVARFDTNGALDTSFDTDGIVVTAHAGVDEAHSVVVQPDGRIVVAGQTAQDFAVIRYNADGSIDRTFGAANTLDGAPAYSENGAPVVLDSNVQVQDLELATQGNYGGASLTLARGGGANPDESFSSTGLLSSIAAASGSLIYNAVTVGTYTNVPGTLTLTFNSSATQARVDGVMQAIAYSSTSDDPPPAALIGWTFSDGNSAPAQGSGAAATVSGSTNFSITAVDDPAVAANDGFAIQENANLSGVNVLNANGNLADFEPDNPRLVTQVQGVGANVGTRFAISSGALVTLNADGTLLYEPNGAFGSLAAPGSGATNTSTADTFTYQLSGQSTATVTVTLTGVDSNDTLLGTAGNDVLNGGIGDDLLKAGAGNNTVNGQAGNDRLVYQGTFDVLNGGTENDTGDFSEFGSAIWGNLTYNGFEVWTVDQPTLATGGTARALADLVSIENLIGTNGDDWLGGDANANRLEARGGRDTLVGGDGDDTLVMGSGFSNADGGSGNDTADLSQFGAAVWANLAFTNVEVWTTDQPALVAGAPTRAVTDLVSVENVIGTNFDDWIAGDGNANRLAAGGGRNTLLGAGGDDTLLMGPGYSDADGGSGNNTADFSQVGAAVWVNLTHTNVQAWTVDQPTLAVAGAARAVADLTNIENLTGSPFDDYLVGDGAANRLGGGAGHNTLLGGGGDDTFIVGVGFADVDGGTGTNTADMSQFAAAVWADLLHTDVEVWTTDQPTLAVGGQARAVADLTNVTNMIGTDYDDWMRGDDNANRIEAGGGRNTLTGAGGDDTLVVGTGYSVVDGGSGSDTVDLSQYGFAVWVGLFHTDIEVWTANAPTLTLAPGDSARPVADLLSIENIIGTSYDDYIITDEANNRITGGGGTDRLLGGAGADTFAYKALSDRGSGLETIEDFSKAQGDVLDLHELLQTFSGYNGSNAFSGGYVEFAASGADTLVRVDSNGGANSFVTLAEITNLHLQQTDTANFVI